MKGQQADESYRKHAKSLRPSDQQGEGQQEAGQREDASQRMMASPLVSSNVTFASVRSLAPPSPKPKAKTEWVPREVLGKAKPEGEAFSLFHHFRLSSVPVRGR
jgi:hypothetical protein